MKIISMVFITSILIFTSAYSFADSQENEFAKAYIYGLGIRRDIEQRSTKDYKEAGNDSLKKDMAIMRNAQRAIMEVQALVAQLDPYLKSKNEAMSNVASATVVSYKGMIANYQHIVQVYEVLSNPANANNKNIDMGKMMSEVSGITAKQEYIADTLFQSSPLVTMALVDPKEDKEGHCSYLLITSDERKSLVNDLDTIYGDEIKGGAKAGQNYTVATGALLRQFLTGQHKSSNERKP